MNLNEIDRFLSRANQLSRNAGELSEEEWYQNSEETLETYRKLHLESIEIFKKVLKFVELEKRDILIKIGDAYGALSFDYDTSEESEEPYNQYNLEAINNYQKSLEIALDPPVLRNLGEAYQKEKKRKW